MKKVAVLLVAMLIATNSFAQVDPDNDMMGLYWDLEGTTICIEGTGQIPLYLLITNPTFENLFAFECGIDVVGSVFNLGIIFPFEAQNFGDNWNLIVGFYTPYPTAVIMHLATFDLLFPTMGQVEFFLHGRNPPSIGDGTLPVVLIDDEELITMGISTLPGTVNAIINPVGGCDGIVATQNSNFDRIKSLYR